MDRQKFKAFMESKRDWGADSGFEPLWMPDFLFDFQQFLVDWTMRKGRSGVFADCGSGKTPMQLVVAQNQVMKTNKPTLLLTPKAVSFQTLEEAEKFDIPAQRAIPGDTTPIIQVTNYEQLHYFDSSDYGAIACDESSILKNDKGIRARAVTEFARTIPYRSLWTATAAPNDWDELGASSEALGYYGHTDMLGKFFTNKQQTATIRKFQNRRDKWRLRGWAAQGPFWQWVTSWSRSMRRPSDLGFDDDGFILPPLEENDIKVEARIPRPGMLFDIEATGFHEEREVIKRTTRERCEAAAERVSQHKVSMVWCHMNAEGKLLSELIPNSIEIRGPDPDKKREEAVKWFTRGTDEKRVLISKPRIFGFGMNFQHCNHMTYFPTHSYEQYYQAGRRLWRYGQSNTVTVDRIFTDGGARILANLDRKARNADTMFTKLVHYMNDALELENTYTHKKIGVPQWLT